MTCAWIALAAACLAMVPLRAQTADTALFATTGDSALDRAIQLTQAGDGDKGRALLDSLLRTTPTNDSLYATTLYWRGTLATTAKDSTRYYNRLLIEAPLSPRVEDALVGLAGIEEARGDRGAAAEHLTRFMLASTTNSQRARVSAWLVRLLFEDSQLARACTALAWARDAVPPDNVELRNRVEYYAPRCADLPTDTMAARDSTPIPSPPAAAPAATRTVPPTSQAPRTPGGQVTLYSLQVAAYETRAPAERAAKALVARGIDARVDGTERPFRVRVGKYATHADALKAVAALKTKGVTGFLTTVTTPRQ